MKVLNPNFAAACVLAVTLLVVTNTSAKTQDRNRREKQKADATEVSDGERKFEIHCGRCHNPPQELSPKAAPAVLRHMRVRAMLTKEDEKAILEYIAP